VSGAAIARTITAPTAIRECDLIDGSFVPFGNAGISHHGNIASWRDLGETAAAEGNLMAARGSTAADAAQISENVMPLTARSDGKLLSSLAVAARDHRPPCSISSPNPARIR
jgi:hypothetical protein